MFVKVKYRSIQQYYKQLLHCVLVAHLQFHFYLFQYPYFSILVKTHHINITISINLWINLHELDLLLSPIKCPFSMYQLTNPIFLAKLIKCLCILFYLVKGSLKRKLVKRLKQRLLKLLKLSLNCALKELKTRDLPRLNNFLQVKLHVYRSILQLTLISIQLFLMLTLLMLLILVKLVFSIKFNQLFCNKTYQIVDPS